MNEEIKVITIGDKQYALADLNPRCHSLISMWITCANDNVKFKSEIEKNDMAQAGIAAQLLVELKDVEPIAAPGESADV